MRFPCSLLACALFTSVVVDTVASGEQAALPSVIISVRDQKLMLVENPNLREWQALGEKLHWASIPNYNWK